uniref:Lipase n=1 Tax=Pristionchus pacificus TaxID=54126 RepID=A0A2A6BCJ1_PRIPA
HIAVQSSIMVLYRILLLVSLLVFSASAEEEEFGPFTKDFVKFMYRNPERNEYAISAFEAYGPNGTFGGKAKNEKMELTHQPVLFIHGNSDSALNYSVNATGWTESVKYFTGQGYKGFEMYGLTYGSRHIENSMNNYIKCRNIVGIRRFIEAVLSYTQADKIDIIAHSMGVSLARKAIQGGLVRMTEEACDLGDSIAHKVDAFVAIAGANYGMCLCTMDEIKNMPACSQEGYTPGTCGTSGTFESCGSEDSECEKDDYASILQQINKGDKEASFIASLWSDDDKVLGMKNLVWGRKTSVVANSDYTHAYDDYDHFEMKTKTYKDQFNLVTAHSRHSTRSKRHY